MRGTRLVGAVHHFIPGIIPAYAGNTHVSPTLRAPMRDHPRVCGEHLMNDAKNKVPSGSSPRMRGTLERSDALPGDDGIIPAYAGNTRVFPSLSGG